MNDDDAPASGPGTEPILRLLPAIAALAVIALLLGRAVAPSLLGIGTGTSRLIHDVGVAGEVISQAFAIIGMMAAVLAVVASARSRLPLVLRVGALSLGGFAILPTMCALVQPLPGLNAALIGVSASILALIAAPCALRAPFARAPAAVLALVALGGVVRLAAVGLALHAGSPGASRYAVLARWVATAAFVCDTAAVAAAIAWIAARARRLGEPQAAPGLPWSPITLAILALALVATRQALLGQVEETRAIDLLFWRAARRLMSGPEPLAPLGFRVFMAFLAPLAAAASLSVRGPVPALGAALALALTAHGALEMPPCALMLIVAALGTALAAQDGRGLWAAIAGARTGS